MYEIRTMSILKKIIEYFPNLKFVYYGRISDNDYLNKLSTMNCGGILYKPLLKVEIEKTLNSLKNKLDFEETDKKYNKKIEERLVENKFWFKEKFIMNLISGSQISEDEINRGFNYYNIEIMNSFRVVLFKIDKFKTILLTLDEEEKNLLTMKIYDTIKKSLKNEKIEIIISNFNEFIVIIDENYELNDVISLLKKVKEDIMNINRIRVTVGIGNSYKEAQEIYISYREAQAALKYRFYLGYNSVIPIQFVEPNNMVTYRYPIEKEHKLVYTAVIGEYQFCKTLVDEIFDSIIQLEYVDNSLIQKIIMDILISINRNLTEQGISLYTIFEEFFKIQDVVSIRNIQEAKNYLIENLKPFCEKMIEIRSEKNKSIFDLSTEYINEYFYETINIEKMAKISGTTGEFIEKIFKDKTGKNVDEYIVSKRIEEVKTLLRESKHNYDYIAVKTGFNNQMHLKEVFQKETNTNIEEYKKRYNIHSASKNSIFNNYRI